MKLIINSKNKHLFLLLLGVYFISALNAKLDIDFDTFNDLSGNMATPATESKSLENTAVSDAALAKTESLEEVKSVEPLQEIAPETAPSAETPHDPDTPHITKQSDPTGNAFLNQKIADKHEDKKEDGPQESAQFFEELRPIVKTIAQDKERKAAERKKKREKEKKEEPQIEFNFKDEKLTTIINEIAAKKGINIVLPQGVKALKTTVTFELDKKIPLSQAEQYLFTMLELAGYTMYPTDGFFVIDKKADNADTTESREPYHLYVNVPPNELPHSSENIHAIYYLSNLQVPNAQTGTDPISSILRDMVGQKKYIYDIKANAIIITGPADKIASAMTILLELDAAGSPEAIEMFPLFNASAVEVAKLLKEQIIKSTNKPQGAGKVSLPEGTGNYFAPNTRIIADTRTNSLVLIGTAAAITRIREFVREYMDQLPDSGKSILHVYDLQYLQAKDFAQVLDNVVKQSQTGQAQKEGGDGALRAFESVIIAAETETTAADGGAGDKVRLGGNRLVIAARDDDYKRIKDLIEQLDKPQLQVIIEIAILDINVTSTKQLQAQLRNPTNLLLHENLQFQTAHITSQITGLTPPPLPIPVPLLATDLLKTLTDAGTKSIAGVQPPGSLIISFKDPCTNNIAALFQVLDQWVEKKVISHPFLVTKNNVKATQSLTTIRQAAGRDVASGGVTTIKIEDFKATLAVEVTPRISSLDRLNLQIRVDIDDFISPDPASFQRTKRIVVTNATMNTGQILILGGLTQDQDIESETKWPILGDIPIIGALFRGQTKIKIKNNLAILIHPTIVNPKLRAGQQIYTDDIIKIAHNELNADQLFTSTKDPITRFFFNVGGQTNDEILTTYLENAHYKDAQADASYKAIEYSDIIDSTGPTKPKEIQEARPIEIGKLTKSESSNPR